MDSHTRAVYEGYTELIFNDLDSSGSRQGMDAGMVDCQHSFLERLVGLEGSYVEAKPFGVIHGDMPVVGQSESMAAQSGHDGVGLRRGLCILPRTSLT